MKEKQDCTLLAKFQYLIDEFNRFDSKKANNSFGYQSVEIDNIRYEAQKNLESFLEAGFDVNQIVKLLSCQAVWSNYDDLKARGAKPGIMKKRVLDYLDWLCDAEEFYKNFVLLFKRGVGFTTLISHISTIDYCFRRTIEERFTREELSKAGEDEETINSLTEKIRKYIK